MKRMNKFFKSFENVFSASVIPIALVVAIIVYMTVMGAPTNFQGNNPENAPIPGNYLGVIYKGGFIVPILMCLLLTVITFSIERYITLKKASGKLNVLKFVKYIKNLLNRKDEPWYGYTVQGIRFKVGASFSF